MCNEGKIASVKLRGGGQCGLPSPMEESTTNISTKMRLVYVAVIQPRPNSVYCSLPVDEVPTNFLTDSGAEISLLPHNHEAIQKRAEQLKSSDVQPVTVDGNPIPLSGRLTVSLKINGNPMPVTFYITTDVKIPPILGLDVMRKLDYVAINFQDNSVTFGPERKMLPHLLAPAPGKQPEVCRVKSSYRVEIDTDTSIPPRHQVRMAGILVAADKEDLSSLEGRNLLVEPGGQLGESLACARSLVTSQDGRVPILICNPFDREVKLKEGMSVGRVEIIPEESAVIANLQEDDEIAMMSAGKTSQSAAQVVQGLCEGAEISAQEKDTLHKFLEQHQDVFSINGEMGRYSGDPFTINTGNARPIRQMPRPVPYHRKAEVDRQLEEMLEKDIIEPSNSEWASPILLVKKSDGTLRFCIDYRKLNAVTKHDAFPLPNIDDCFASLGEDSEYFSTLDFYRGYWQVDMDRESQEKAAFTTHRGLFQPKVLPFGPRGGVAHFSRIMSALLGSLQWKMLLVYLDDLLIFSNTFEEHLRRLDLVFRILREANLKLKPSKCQLLRRSVNFLGHVISSEGIAPNEEKIKAVSQWKAPKTLDELKQFLGFASYYRRYVKDFSTRSEPLNRLTRKKVTYHWDAKCNEAFEFLKSALTQHPLLAHPDFKIPFHLTTDASGTGLGAVLSQVKDGKERPIAYASRALTAAERNYNTTERECLATVWATDHFDYYLSGAHFIIVTDHDPLTYLKSIDQPQGRLARWILKLEQYNYSIKHKPGTSIPHADALSRQTPTMAMVQLPHEYTLEELVVEQAKDPIVQKVCRYWENQQRPPAHEQREVKDFFRKRGATIMEENGVLYIKSKFKDQDIKQLVTPLSLVHRIIEKAHDEEGHFAWDSLLDKVRKKYYWATLFRDVKAWCQTCEGCQQRKHPSTSPRAPLQYPPVASYPGQMIAIDFVGPLPQTAEGNKYLLVITDMFSKYADAIPCPNQEAETTADALVNKYFCKQGLPDILHSDQGRNFESQVIQHLCRIMNIHKTRTSPYHPASNGQCERYNKTLIGMVSLHLNEDQTDWDRWVPMMLFAYNSKPHASTKLTPFQLQMGRQPRTPFDTIAETLIETKKKTAHSYLEGVQKKMSEVHKVAQRNLMDAMERRKTYRDKNVNYTIYHKGDLVLLRQLTCKPGLKPKLLKERWTGPWRVDAVRGPVNYRITRKVQGKKKRVLVHHDRLKAYKQRPAHLVDPPDHEAVEDPVQQQSQAVEKELLQTDYATDFALERLSHEVEDSESEEEGENESEESEEEDLGGEEQGDEDEADNDGQLEEETPVTTRSGRVTRRPAHLNDYV